MTGISISLITGSIAIATFVLGTIWGAAKYTHQLDVQITENREGIKRLRKDLKYAYKILENAHKGLEVDVFDIQGFLMKAPIEPKFQIRGRSDISSNSGADFLEERID